MYNVVSNFELPLVVRNLTYVVQILCGFSMIYFHNNL